jgi:hypothetical protein
VFIIYSPAMGGARTLIGLRRQGASDPALNPLTSAEVGKAWPLQGSVLEIEIIALWGKAARLQAFNRHPSPAVKGKQRRILMPFGKEAIEWVLWPGK